MLEKFHRYDTLQTLPIAEWHRQRYLKALLKYLDDGVDNNAIYTDILDILQERSSQHMLNMNGSQSWNLCFNLNNSGSTVNTLNHIVSDWNQSVVASLIMKKFLEDMIWAEKLAKAHTLARDWLNKARRQSNGIEEGVWRIL